MSAPLSLDRPREQGLAATVEGMLDGYRQLRAAHPQYYPMPAWPEPGGFLPFASTIDGDQIGWCADGPPETWRVAVDPRHWDQGPPLPGDFTATLLTWLRGGPAESRLPRSDRPGPASAGRHVLRTVRAGRAVVKAPRHHGLGASAPLR